MFEPPEDLGPIVRMPVARFHWVWAVVGDDGGERESEREGKGASDHAPVTVRFAQSKPITPLWPPAAPA